MSNILSKAFCHATLSLLPYLTDSWVYCTSPYAVSAHFLDVGATGSVEEPINFVLMSTVGVYWRPQLEQC